MKAKLLNPKELEKLQRTSLPEFIIEAAKELELDLLINKLKEDLSPIFDSGELKIRITNLVNLLNILVQECKSEPLTGKILIEVPKVLELLNSLKNCTETKECNPLISGKATNKEVNNRIKAIIEHLEEWRKILREKIHLPPGNKHTRDTYHPEFPETYKFKPSTLPEDYRSNWFFEAHIKEFCSYTTLIPFHPYSDVQASEQEARDINKLLKTDLEVELRDSMAIEKIDNIRAFRIHGPKEDKNYPGSYLIIRGGHHRLRELFKRYLKRELSGELKILIQRVTEKDFPIPAKELMISLKEEIRIRDRIRKEL